MREKERDGGREGAQDREREGERGRESARERKDDLVRSIEQGGVFPA